MEIQGKLAKIYPKIDYYTAMWKDSTIHDVLRFIGQEDAFEDFMKDKYEAIKGIDANINFKYNFIELSIPYVDFIRFYPDIDSVDADIFDLKVPRIRLNISGQGLDFLRAQEYNVDVELLRSPLEENLPFHLTRVDIAYDFVDYDDTFVDQCIDHLIEVERVRGRGRRALLIGKDNYGTTFSVKAGKDHTIYLGSTSSDKLVRIYDKKMQYMKDDIWVKECPYGSDIDSWFRIELQLRNAKANEWLFSKAESPRQFYEIVLRKICEQYTFRSIQSTIEYTKEKPEPAEFWLSLWDWSLIPDFIQNAKFNNHEYKTPVEAIDDWGNWAALKLLMYVSTHGLTGVISLLKKTIESLNKPSLYRPDEYKRQKRRIRLKGMLNELCKCEGYSGFVRVENGNFNLALEDMLKEIE